MSEGSENVEPAMENLVERNLLGRIAELERERDLLRGEIDRHVVSFNEAAKFSAEMIQKLTREKEELMGEVVALVNVMAHLTDAMNVTSRELQAVLSAWRERPPYQVARTIAVKACQDAIQASSQPPNRKGES